MSWAKPLVLVWACVAGAYGGCARPPGALDDDDGVRLRFSWPTPATAQVEASLERVRSQGDADDRELATARWSMDAVGDGASTVVRSYALEVDDPRLRRAPAAIAALVLGAQPPFRVDRGGRFERVDDPDAPARQVEASLDAAGDDARHRLLRQLDPAMITRAVSADWSRLVGDWAGRRLVPGEHVAEAATLAVPQLAAGVADTRVELWLEGVVPCERGAPEAGCVQLRRVEQLEPQAAAEVGRAMALGLRAMMAAEGFDVAPTVEHVSVTYDHTLITEPTTLLPHAHVEVKRMELSVSTADGAIRVAQTDVLARSFRWTR